MVGQFESVGPALPPAVVGLCLGPVRWTETPRVLLGEDRHFLDHSEHLVVSVAPSGNRVQALSGLIKDGVPALHHLITLGLPLTLPLLEPDGVTANRESHGRRQYRENPNHSHPRRSLGTDHSPRPEPFQPESDQPTRYGGAVPKRSSKPRDLNQMASAIVDSATSDEPEADPDEGKNPAAVALGRLGGRKGGKSRAEKLTPEERSEFARRAAQTRWGNNAKRGS